MKNLASGFLLLAWLVVWVGQTQSQTPHTVSGTVTSDTGEPLWGASVTVQGTRLGAITDEQGRYAVDLPGSAETLVFSLVGYRSIERAVEGAAVVDAVLRLDLLELDEIVVTGVATSVKRASLANSVGSVSASVLQAVPAQTLDRALNGKVSGLYISQNTGAPGGGINVNLRGTSTITGDTQPLYVVDGVIFDNSAIQSGIDEVTDATGGGVVPEQGQPTNRIADINANDIENIEILKGASASAIYGSKATNGVVIITTRQGRPGKTRVQISQQIGYQTLSNKIGFRTFTPETAEAALAGGADLLARNGHIDYEDLLYGRKGLLRETSVSASGGTNDTRFYVSGLVQDEDGIIQNTGYRKRSGRINITHDFGTRVRASVFTTLARTESDRSITGNENQGSTTLGFAQVFTLPFIDLRPDSEGKFPDGPGSNPLHTVQVFQNNELVNRFTGSGRVDWNLVQTGSTLLDLNLQGGADFYSLEHKVVSPPELQFEQAKDSAIRGISVAGEVTSLSSNLALSLVHRFQTTSGIAFNTAAGLQYESREINDLHMFASGLVVTQENIDQASSLRAEQDRLIQRERGFFIQEEVDLRGRIFLTAGLRADASSRIGDTGKYYTYPKVSGSIRLSEYDFWNAVRSVASEFKIRAAFGRAGNLPGFNARFTSLVPENIDGLGGVLVPELLGNEAIEPEVTQEIELGFDVGLLDERAGLEFTFYNQNISDLILKNSLPPSSGYNAQFINAGKMRTRGVEASLTLTPISRPGLSWNARLNFGKTSSRITQLDIDPFEVGGFGLSLGQFLIEEGKSPTTIVGLDASSNKVEYGDENPDFVMSWINSLSVKDFTFHFLWDWKSGGDVLNLGRFLSDIGGTTPDLDTQEGMDRVSNPNLVERYVEDGSYLRLREIGLTYQVPLASLQRMNSSLSRLTFGIYARNLWTITDYTGYDPEVSQFGNVPIGRAIDALPFPPSRSFYFRVALGI